MLKRLPTHWLASSLFLAALLVAWPDQAQAQVSDQFSTSDPYDRFAVGGAHRWYDNHSSEAKAKSSHCLSMLDEAKTYQEAAFVLYAQAKQPGLASTQRTALRRQGMEQIKLRENKIRAFIDCFNLANRQKSQRSDQFATRSDSQPPVNRQTQPVSKSPPPRRNPAQKPASDNQGKSSDVFSTTGDKTPSDEIQTQPHSDRPHGTPSDEIRTKPNPSDVLNTDPESRTAKNNSSLEETKDDSDCLPQIDSHVLALLEAEQNEIIKTLAGGGYVTNLFIRTLSKLQAAHLHHLTEPNEGLLSRTTRTVKRALDRAPETVVQAGRAVAQYLANDTDANHHYFYGQVEMAAHKAEQEVKKRLRNPHITLAETADSFLVGKATGTVCRWTEVRVVQLRAKIDKARQASKRLRAIEDLTPPGSGSCGPQREDCFWRTLQNATGDPSYLLRKERPSWEEVYEKLKRHFGGANAKDPLTRRPGDLQKMAEGRPVPITTDDFAKVIDRMPNNSEGMVFVVRDDGSSHVFNVAKFAGQYVFWDDQARSSNMDILFAGVKSLRWFRYK